MKVSWHIQRLQPWMAPLLSQWEPAWVKIVDPPPADPFPGIGVRKLVRFWHDDIQANYIAREREGGRAWVREYLVPRLLSWAAAYETANEPDCNSPVGLANLREYTLGAIEEANKRGIKLCILNLPEGNPGADPGLVGNEARNSEIWKLAQLAEAVKAANQAGHYVGLHAYWLPPKGIGPLDRWHGLGRVMWNVERWVEMGTEMPRVLVNETGVDGYINEAYPRKGWRSLVGLPDYVRQVCQLEAAARQLPYIEGLMLFTVGFEEPWGDYDHKQADLEAMMAELRKITTPETAYGPDPTVPYWHSDRHGQKVEWVILHDTEGTAEAALNWWRNPNNPGRSSAHYLVRASGEIIPVVPEKYAAHHAGGGKWPGIPDGQIGGTSIINLVSIGIEMEYPAEPASPPWPEAQLRAAANLMRDVAVRYNIPRERILFHREVDPDHKRDPRNLYKEVFLSRVFTLDEEEGRRAAWERLGVAYNPNAAFVRVAREQGLGAPLGNEFDYRMWRMQCFANGIVYALVGDWGNVRVIKY